MSRPPITTLTPKRRLLLAAFRRLARRGPVGVRALGRAAGIAETGPAQRGLAILVRLGCVEAIPAPGIGYRLRRH